MSNLNLKFKIMKSFIEKQQQYNYSSTNRMGSNGGMLEQRRYPPKHQCDATDSRKATIGSGNEYKISNAELQKMSKYHEIDPNNNNVFAGKNLSDNTKITSFYTLKSATPYQSPLIYYGQDGKQAPEATGATRSVPASSMIKELFTNDIAADQCDGCRPGDPPLSKVSNLIGKVTMNQKYDDAWYLKNNP